jgi:hypothetical protein
MPDDSLDFLIRTTYDSAGTNAAGKAFAELRGNVAQQGQESEGVFKSLNEKIEESVGSHKKFISAVKLVSPELAGLGHEILFGLTNPLIGSIVALGVAAEAVHKLAERSAELQALLDHTNDVNEAIERARQNTDAWKESLDQASIAAENFALKLERIKNQEETLREATDDAVEAMKMQAAEMAKGEAAEAAAAKANVDAQQKAGKITEAEAQAQKNAIDVAADRKKTAEANATDQKEITLRQGERDEAARRETDRKLDVNHAQAADTHAGNTVATLSEVANELKKTIEEKNREANDPKASAEAKEGARADSRFAGQKLDEVDSQLAEARSAKARTAADLQAAQEKATAEATLKVELDRQIKKLQEEANIKAEGRAREDTAKQQERDFKAQGEAAGSKTGKVVNAAAEAEFAHEQGRQGTQQQEAAFRLLHQQLGAQADVILRGLASAHNQMSSYLPQLQAAVARIERLEHQGRGTFTP